MLLLAFVVSLVGAALPAAAAQAAPEKPSRVVIIVLDQARPDTITRYGMTNVQELQRKGKSFHDAYVGHMAAETVISHNVITSGRFPKHMGWTNEVYRDTDGVLGAPGNYYVTSSMSCAEFKALIEHGDYPKIQDYLDSKFGESSSFATFTQKRTSACTSGHTSPAADGTGTDLEDIILQIRGSRRTCGTNAQWRQPESGNGSPPPWIDTITGGCANRWWTDQTPGAYGTGSMSPANLYPLDGNRFVPGFDPQHLGGDTWSADAAIEEINNDPNWHGMMVSLGGIDKVGHMWGPDDQGEPGTAPGSEAEMRHMPFVARNADEQVGRIVDALRNKGLLDETLIVITADHAAQTGRHFHGVLAPGVTNPLCAPPSTGIRSDCNWYLGTDADEIYEDPSPAVAQLRSALGGNLAFSYQDSQVGAWLNDLSAARKREGAAAVLDMPDVVASYYTNAAQDQYRLYGTKHMTGAERSWFARHAQELVNTMAAPNGPDVVGLTATDTTYGVIGDHGGANELVQRIPMVFYGPGVSPKDSNRDMRLVDVMPTILKTMGIAYDPSDLDGQAMRLSKPQG
ncbi:MAG TPA: alkaline phosphatase family protein [Thermoleophilaceae bacterium]|nr:alkaline phosphatase family protein [Thermoleophilaceae bacterium]